MVWQSVPGLGVVGVPATTPTAGATTSAAQASPAPTPTAPTSTPSEPTSSDPCVGLEPTAGHIPEQALSLRLCPYGEESLRPFAPLDALDWSHAGPVLSVLRSATAVTGVQVCSAELGPRFLMVTEYSGRDPVVMEVQQYGCRNAGTATDRRSAAADRVVDEFRRHLTSQRIGIDQVQHRGVTLCSPQWQPRGSVMPVSLAQVSGGVACRYPSRNVEQAASQVSLTSTQVATFAADLTAHSAPWEPRPCPMPPPGPTVALALLNAWGDVLSITPDGCPGTYTYFAGGEQLLWTPGTKAEQLLTRVAS